MSDKPVTVAVATYADKSSAEQDYDAIRGIKHQGQIDHLAIAMVVKDDDGERTTSATRHRRSSGPSTQSTRNWTRQRERLIFAAPARWQLEQPAISRGVGYPTDVDADVSTVRHGALAGHRGDPSPGTGTAVACRLHVAGVDRLFAVAVGGVVRGAPTTRRCPA